ncbi:MAG TPA: PAS domain-containing sensor histidine kinase [Candidatus Avalokitesvara rifleensis]|uniref:PAS domain-containing sensor histidine kinase n=1 Tax=Candidatus Avalokitesvara rifleensis TaxID=3367620 RepID=UPI004028B63D
MEYGGSHFTALCSPGEAEEVRRVLGDTIRFERVRHLEVSITSKGGKIIPVAWNFSSMRDEKGSPVGLVGIGRDLTETKQLQAQLFQSDKLASLGVLAGGIAHEIRNPLGVSSAAAQLFLERPDDPQLLEECAQKIHSGIQRASEIIERLLQFARPTTRRSEPTNINQILEEALELTSKQLVHQHISVQKEFHGAVPMINADGKLLKQVFLNIILNASNAMSEGGRLWIKTSVEKKQQPHQIEITFKDSGPGIPKEDIDKVFDPFFTTMPVGEGTGLGLSICYGIIKEHGGTIRVESNPGRGSVFVITLPLTRRDL